MFYAATRDSNLRVWYGEQLVASFYESITLVAVLLLVGSLICVGGLFEVVTHEASVRSHNILDSLFAIVVSPTAQVEQALAFESKFEAALKADGITQFVARGSHFGQARRGRVLC